MKLFRPIMCLLDRNRRYAAIVYYIRAVSSELDTPFI